MRACLLALLCLASAAHAADAPVRVRLPDGKQLARAARGDDAELERVAVRLGPNRLLQLAGPTLTQKRDERRAALRAIALLEDAWVALPGLTALSADADAEVALDAALATRRIAEGLHPERLVDEEIPRDALARAATLLLAQARKAEVAGAARAHLVAALSALRAVTHIDDKALAALADDGEAEVRHAVAEAGVDDATLQRLLTSDDHLDVAAAAGAALCREVAWSEPTSAPGKPAPPPTPAQQARKLAAEARAAKLPPPARERLRALAVDGNVALVDRIDLIGCLRVAMQPADKALLDQLAARGPDALKRRARALGGR